jgi:hypothetical protein
MSKLFTVLGLMLITSTAFAVVKIQKTDNCQCERVSILNRLEDDFANYQAYAYKITFYTESGELKWQSNAHTGFYPTISSCLSDCKVFKGEAQKCDK